MHILAMTDIHGAYALAEQIILRESADVVIIGGDLTTVGTVREAAEAIRTFRGAGRNVYCIAGNMDLPEHDALFRQLGISLNGTGVRIGEVGFFGVSGSPRSRLHTPHEFTESELAQTIARGYADIRSAPRKIFVPHAPPYGTGVDAVHSGAHVGSTAVRDFIREEQPDVVICGHIHEARGQDTIGRSKIVNCGTAAHGYYAKIMIGESVTIENLRFKTP